MNRSFFWMVDFGLEKPATTSLHPSHINKCYDTKIERLTDIDLYPEFGEAIENLYDQGMRNTEEIYKTLLSEGKVPIVKKGLCMKFKRSVEYINSVRKKLKIPIHDGSKSQRIIALINNGINETKSIISKLAEEGIVVQRQHVNDARRRLKTYRGQQWRV